MAVDEDYMLKKNILKLASEHKSTCKDPNCGVSIYFVAVLLERAGIRLTKSESSKLL